MAHFAANRVVQLDAGLLDQYLLAALRTKLDNIAALQLTDPKWQLIYSDLVRGVLPAAYFLQQAFTGQSPGQRLLGLRFHKWTLLKSTTYYVCNALFLGILELLANSQLLLVGTRSSARHRMQRLVEKLIAYMRLISSLHFFYFLYRGGPVNLLERIFNIETVFKQRPSIGLVNYTALNRELIGHACGHLFLMLSPCFRIIAGKAKSLVAVHRQKSRLPPDQERRRQIVCDACQQHAICPVEAKKAYEEASKQFFCYYCYFVTTADCSDWRLVE